MLVEEFIFCLKDVEAELIMIQCLYPVTLVASLPSWGGKENQIKLLMSCNWPKSIDMNKGVQESWRLFCSWFNLCPLVIHHYVCWAMARLDWLQCLYPVHHPRWLVHNHEEEKKIKQNLIDVMQLPKSIDIDIGVCESWRLFCSWFNLCPLVIHQPLYMLSNCWTRLASVFVSCTSLHIASSQSWKGKENWTKI